MSNLWWWIWRLGGGLAVPISLLYIYAQIYHRKIIGLKNKVVLITGASSGLGEACAHVFYRAGCKVILAGRRGQELERVKLSLLSVTPESLPYQLHPPEVVVLDITDTASLQSKVESVLRLHSTIDILINNAGISYRGEIENTDLQVYKKLMEVNYFGQIAITKEVLPVMLKQKSGTVVFVSSMQGKLSIPYRSAYSASKHAIQAFGDCLRAEVADRNVAVCVISPAYIQTKLSLNALCGNGSTYGVMDSTTASGMTPQTVAQVVLQAVVHRQKDVILSPLSHKMAIFIRTLMPSLFFWLMQRRANKQTVHSQGR